MAYRRSDLSKPPLQAKRKAAQKRPLGKSLSDCVTVASQIRRLKNFAKYLKKSLLPLGARQRNSRSRLGGISPEKSFPSRMVGAFSAFRVNRGYGQRKVAEAAGSNHFASLKTGNLLKNRDTQIAQNFEIGRMYVGMYTTFALVRTFASVSVLPHQLVP